MQSIVFEDAAVAALGPLVAARPASDLTIGTGTLVEALDRFGPVRRAPRAHLRRHLAALGGTRVPLWGGRPDARPPATPASRHGDTVLLVNARLVPDRGALVALRSLVERGRRAVGAHVQEGGGERAVRESDAAAAPFDERTQGDQRAAVGHESRVDEEHGVAVP